MALLTLSNDLVSVTLAPKFGARVTSLIDLRSGRDWLVPGPCIGGSGGGESGNEASYLGDEARGWDECFPTVAPCDSADWGRHLRDHGDIWGRPVDCQQTTDSILSTYHGAGYVFERRITLKDDLLTMHYRVDNTGSSAFPYLWSQHCLLATGPDDRLELEDIGQMNVTGVLGHERPTPDAFSWPHFDASNIDLRQIQPTSAGWALKAYAAVKDRVCARVVGRISEIALEWSGDQVPFLGLWLDYGGWPDTKPVHQIAIEPTTSPADDLANALALGQARVIEPGSSQQWEMSIRLTDTLNMETKS